MIILDVHPDDDLTAAARTIATGPTAVHLAGDWSAAVDQIRAVRLVDRAVAVSASPSTAGRLSDAGCRTPIVEADQSGGASHDRLAAFADRPLDATPRIEGETLTAGAHAPRWTVPTTPRWSLEESRARIEADKATIIPGWVDYLDAHGERFAQMFRMLPEAPPGGRALDTAIFPATCRALSDLGYFTVAAHYADEGDRELYETYQDIWTDNGVDVELRYDAELHRLPCEDELFDLVLAAEIIEHMPSDPMQFLVELNRVMRWGATIVVTTPNAVSQRALSLAFDGRHPGNYYFFDRHGSLDRHHLEFTPDLLIDAVEAAGFEIELFETIDVWWERDARVMELLRAEGHDTDQRGDNMYCVAKKVRSVVDRTPPSLYTGEQSDFVFAHRNQPRVQRLQQLRPSRFRDPRETA